jgi:2-iminobutanoate/2-iminopropanoate deaminase
MVGGWMFFSWSFTAIDFSNPEKNATFSLIKKKKMKKQIIQTPDAPMPIGPYSQGVVSGNLIFISGQVAIDPANGDLITHDIKEETRRVMENLKAILVAAGVDLSHVVKTSIFLMDMKDFTPVNEVYSSYFNGEYPARETVQVAALPRNVHVEISMIAMK